MNDEESMYNSIEVEEDNSSFLLDKENNFLFEKKEYIQIKEKEEKVEKLSSKYDSYFFDYLISKHIASYIILLKEKEEEVLNIFQLLPYEIKDSLMEESLKPLYEKINLLKKVIRNGKVDYSLIEENYWIESFIKKELEKNISNILSL